MLITNILVLILTILIVCFFISCIMSKYNLIEGMEGVDNSSDANSDPTDSTLTDSTSTDSASTDNATTDSATTDSASTNNATTDSATTDNATTDSATTDSTTTDSASTDSATTDSATNDNTTNSEDTIYKFNCVNGKCELNENGIYGTEEECNSICGMTCNNTKEETKPDMTNHTLERCTPVVNVSYYTNNYSSDTPTSSINPSNNEPLQQTYTEDTSITTTNDFAGRNAYRTNDEFIDNILNQKSNYCPVIMGNSNGYGEFQSRSN